jgi:CubicO group peptidase (beta-lactamase class C family)
MKRAGAAFLSALLGVACTSPAPRPEPTKPATTGIDDVLRTAVENKKIPGAVAVVVTPEGVAYRAAFGMSPDAIVAIASMTKAITSLAVMQLVDAGKVKLDEPAATYLPELASLKVLDAGKLRPPKSPPTVRQLLAHTSGFVYEFTNRELADYLAKTKLPSVFVGGDGFMKAPLLFDPGARWEYGIGIDWLGRLVERVSGQTLEAYMRQAIFEPLGMADTSFNVPPDKQARRVPTFRRAEDGSLAASPPEPLPPVEFFSGGGGLYSTADDYAKFVRAILGGGQLGPVRVLSSASVDQMAQNQIGDLSLRLLPSLMPHLVNDKEPLPGRPDKFGLGFAMNTTPIEKGRGAGTLTWGGIFNTFFWIDREKKVGAVIVIQMLPFLEEGTAEVVESFDRAVYAWRDSATPR